MVAWLTFAAFDMIGHMCFGENFGCLDRGEYVPFVDSIGAMASELTLTQICKYWGVMALRRLLTPRRLMGQRMKHIGSAMASVQRRIEKGSEHRDFLHYILAANDEKGLSAAEIHVNAFSLSIAGSESTATSLIGALFFLLTYPCEYERLVSELREAHADGREVTLASTHPLPLLDAVITETLRLYPPVAIPMPRVVPEGGATIANAYIPSGVTVGVPHYSISRHPAHFHHADEFIPDRWLNRTEAGATDKVEASQPFSFGPRNCLGKNIARAEMRLVLAKLLVAFDWRLAGNQEDWLMTQKVQGFWQKSPLWCEVTRVGSG
jgi:cytochrome P450